MSVRPYSVDTGPFVSWTEINRMENVNTWTATVLEIRFSPFFCSSEKKKNLFAARLMHANFSRYNFFWLHRKRYYNAAISFAKFTAIIINLFNELCKTFAIRRSQRNVSNNFEWNFFISIFFNYFFFLCHFLHPNFGVRSNAENGIEKVYASNIHYEN